MISLVSYLVTFSNFYNVNIFVSILEALKIQIDI